jgi:hypothetical protein
MWLLSLLHFSSDNAVSPTADKMVRPSYGYNRLQQGNKRENFGITAIDVTCMSGVIKIWLNNLKSVERRKSNFFQLRYLFFHPLNSAALDGRIAPPLPPPPPAIPNSRIS